MVILAALYRMLDHHHYRELGWAGESIHPYVGLLTSGWEGVRPHHLTGVVAGAFDPPSASLRASANSGPRQRQDKSAPQGSV